MKYLEKKNLWYKSIIQKLALKYKKDVRVIEYITNYPFVFTQNVISSDDERPVRLKHLGAFDLKYNKTKKDLFEKRINDLFDNVDKLVEAGKFDDKETCIKHITFLQKNNKFEEVHKLTMDILFDRVN